MDDNKVLLFMGIFLILYGIIGIILNVIGV